MQTITHPDWADAEMRADTEAETALIEKNRTDPWCYFLDCGEGLVDAHRSDDDGYVETIEVPLDPQGREATLRTYLGW